MMITTAALRQLTGKHMAQIADGLRQTAAQVDPRGIIRSGDWSNSAGLVNAYVSYYPAGDTSQEAIEGILSLTPVGTGFRLVADICRSDGQIIAEIIERDVQAAPEAEMESEIASIIEELQADMTVRLLALLASGSDETHRSTRQTAD